MKNILVPTDFSEVAQNATTYAIQLAKKTGAKLCLFHATGHQENASRKDLQKLLKELKPQGIEHEFFVSDKFFNSMTIAEFIDLKSIDLIVMGTIGDDGGFKKNIFGTNTGELLDDLRCPLLAVPENCSFTKLNKLAYASDLNDLNAELPRLARFAETFDAEITVFHVSPVYPDLGDVEKRNIPKEIEAIASGINYRNINYHKEKMNWDNQVHKGISRFIESRRPDLLVLFHQNQNDFDRFFSSSHSQSAVKDFDLPMLVFPKRERS